MGGSIAVLLRTPEGETYSMTRWTNPLPDFINNLKFIQKSKEHIDRWMKQWLDMKQDWEEHQVNKRRKYKLPMTSCYAPYPAPRVPVEYGMIVLDMQKNVIAHAQGYCAIGNVCAASVSLDLMRLQDGMPEDEDSAYLNVKNLWEAGKCKGLRAYETGHVEHFISPEEMGGNTFAHCIEWMEKFDKIERKINHDYYEKHQTFPLGRLVLSDFPIDMSPFTVIRYNEDQSGFRGLKEKIQELGFELSKEENQGWDKYIKQRAL